MAQMLPPVTVHDFDPVIVPPGEAPAEGVTLGRFLSYGGARVPQVSSERHIPRDAWSTSLFACHQNWQICAEEALCACCHVAYLLSFLECDQRDLDPCLWAPLAAAEVATCFSGTFRCFAAFELRARVARRYDIHESACAAVCIPLCCTRCAMCQLHRELHRRGDVTGGLIYRTPPKATPVGTVLDAHGRPASSTPLARREPFAEQPATLMPPLANYGYDNGNFSGYPLAVDTATDDDADKLSNIDGGHGSVASDDPTIIDLDVAYSDAEASPSNTPSRASQSSPRLPPAHS